ncbi:FAD:protein FMN transferase [bacterium]|jgi:FAD:protein FMN transferase|nr:FAD:protein FMN transferase [bacterium]
MKPILFICTFFVFQAVNAESTFKRTLKLMGSRFEITVIAENTELGDQYIEEAVAEITRIERLISSWNPESQTSEINRQAGIIPVKVDLELYQLIERANGISNLTDGAFDISYASMDRIWKFDGSMTIIPSAEEIKHSVSKVGYQKIKLNASDTTVFLTEKGMKIGFGAIGKGYAADKAKALLIEKGVKGGIINASGDMNTWGKQTNGEDWKVAITNPLNKDKAIAIFPLNNSAVVTSGDYEKYIKLEGKKFAHIIDPRTGYPTSGIISATVFAPKAELADALATSIFVMGVNAGIDRINQLPNIECIIINDEGKIFTSTNIKIKNK